MHVDWGPTARLPQAARPGITQRQARIFFGCAFLTMPLGFLALTPRVVVLWIVVLAAIGACLILAGLVGKSGLPRVETK